MRIGIVESAEDRRARYTRMAIAAAAAAARTPLPEVRIAYLLVAESWSNLAKAEDENAQTAPLSADESAMPKADGHRQDAG